MKIFAPAFLAASLLASHSVLAQEAAAPAAEAPVAEAAVEAPAAEAPVEAQAPVEVQAAEPALAPMTPPNGLAEVAKVGPWNVMCDDMGGCVAETSISVTDQESGPRISLFLLPAPEATPDLPFRPSPSLTVLAPLGVILHHEPALVSEAELAGSSASTATYEACAENGCTATAAVNLALASTIEDPVVTILTPQDLIGVKVPTAQLVEVGAALDEAYAARADDRATAAAEATEAETATADVSATDTADAPAEVTETAPAE